MKEVNQILVPDVKIGESQESLDSLFSLSFCTDCQTVKKRQFFIIFGSASGCPLVVDKLDRPVFEYACGHKTSYLVLCYSTMDVVPAYQRKVVSDVSLNRCRHETIVEPCPLGDRLVFVRHHLVWRPGVSRGR